MHDPNLACVVQAAASLLAADRSSDCREPGAASITSVAGSLHLTVVQQCEASEGFWRPRRKQSSSRVTSCSERPMGRSRDRCRIAQAAQTLVPPKVLEPVGRHFGVPDRVLNVLVPEVVLQRPRVMAVVGKLEPTGMTKHVRVDWEWHLRGLADAVDESMETDGADGPAALGNEYVSVSRIIAP
jgi:hypothetical protein